MQAPSDLVLCSPLAQRAFDRLLKMGNGSRVRANSVMERLGRWLEMDQTEIKGAVRELYRAGLLRYAPDRQELPANGMIEIVRPEKTISDTEQEWNRVLNASGMSEAAREAFRPFFCKVGDFTRDDLMVIAQAFASIEADYGAGIDSCGFNYSARRLMGGSKVLSNLTPRMMQAIGLPLRLFNSSPRYVVCAGSQTPEATLLIENPRAFENAVRSGLGDFVALVCTYGFGLSYLGQVWREDTHSEDKPIQIIRAGTPGPLTSLLLADRVFLWADLDLAALSIFRSLKTAIPQLKFSGIYKVMIEMALDSCKSHPYAAIFEKDGQTQVASTLFDASDAVAQTILKSCRMRAVDQEAVIEHDILRLGRVSLEIGD